MAEVVDEGEAIMELQEGVAIMAGTAMDMAGTGRSLSASIMLQQGRSEVFSGMWCLAASVQCSHEYVP